jgi:hypothetical protein
MCVFFAPSAQSQLPLQAESGAHESLPLPEIGIFEIIKMKEAEYRYQDTCRPYRITALSESPLPGAVTTGEAPEEMRAMPDDRSMEWLMLLQYLLTLKN